jgi:hypothetical protein
MTVMKLIPSAFSSQLTHSLSPKCCAIHTLHSEEKEQIISAELSSRDFARGGSPEMKLGRLSLLLASKSLGSWVGCG